MQGALAAGRRGRRLIPAPLGVQLLRVPLRADQDRSDLRGGAAMLIAGLCAKGTTALYDIRHIERGYPDFAAKLTAIGADVCTAAEKSGAR